MENSSGSSSEEWELSQGSGRVKSLSERASSASSPRAKWVSSLRGSWQIRGSTSSRSTSPAGSEEAQMASAVVHEDSGMGSGVYYSGEPNQGLSLDMFVWQVSDIIHYKAKKAKEVVTPIHAYKEVQKRLKQPALAVGQLHHKQNKAKLLAYQEKVAPGFSMTFAAASAMTPRPGSGGSRAESPERDYGLQELIPPRTVEERRRERALRERYLRREYTSAEEAALEAREAIVEQREAEQVRQQQAREVPRPGDPPQAQEGEDPEEFRARLSRWGEQMDAHFVWREAQSRAERAAQTPARGGRPQVGLPATPSSAAVSLPVPWEAADEWNPVEELIELLRLHFETPTAEKIEAFNRFARAAGESAMTAASRFTEICALADTIDNRMQVEKWMSTLDMEVADTVGRDPRFRAGDKHAPLQVIIKLTYEEEKWRALRKGVQLSLPGGRKESGADRREKSLDRGKGREKESWKGWREKKEDSFKKKSRFKEGGGAGGAASFVATPAQLATPSRGCYICGGDHLKKNCPKLGQEIKCYNCGKMGHMAAACNSAKANGKPPQRTGGGKQKMRSPSQAPGGQQGAAPVMQASTSATASSSASSNQVPASVMEQLMARMARLEGKQAMTAGSAEELNRALPASSAFYEGRHYSAVTAFRSEQWQEGELSGEKVSRPVMVTTRQSMQVAEPRGASREHDAQRGELRRQLRLPQSFPVKKDLVGGHLPSNGPAAISQRPVVNADSRQRIRNGEVRAPSTAAQLPEGETGVAETQWRRAVVPTVSSVPVQPQAESSSRAQERADLESAIKATKEELREEMESWLRIQQRQMDQQKAEEALRLQQETALSPTLPLTASVSESTAPAATGGGLQTVVLRGMGELVKSVKDLTTVVHKLAQQAGGESLLAGVEAAAADVAGKESKCSGCASGQTGVGVDSLEAAVTLMESAPTFSLEERKRMQPGVTVLCNADRVFQMEALDESAMCFPQRVIIDSGAQPVLVGARVAKALGLVGDKLVPCPFAIQTSLGGQDQAEGATKEALLLTLFPGVEGKEAKVRVKVVVTAAESYDVLLGAAFLSTLGFVIDYRQPNCYFYPGMSEHDHRKVSLPVVFYGRCPVAPSAAAQSAGLLEQRQLNAEAGIMANVGYGSAFVGFFWVDPWHEVMVEERGAWLQLMVPSSTRIGTARRADFGMRSEGEPSDSVEVQYQPGLRPQVLEDLQPLFARERQVQECEAAEPGFMALPRTSGDFWEMGLAPQRVLPALATTMAGAARQQVRPGRVATAGQQAGRQQVLTRQRQREPVIVPANSQDPWQLLREAPIRYWLQVGLHV